jgi:hypothetical protein
LIIYIIQQIILNLKGEIKMGRVLAGVMPFDLFDAEGNLILTTNTLTDEGINSTVDKDEIRGGSANQLLGNYFYGSNLELNCVDALFSLEYLALKMGANIEMGSDVQLSESITITEANKITPSKTPVAFPSTQLIVGSYKLPTESSDDWKTIRFENGSATVAGLKVGDTVCVKYFYRDASARQFKVPSDIIPSVVKAVAKVPEFASSTEGGDFTTKSRIGVLQVVIPKFQLDPSVELAVTSSGHATMDCKGNALAVFEGTCDGEGYYAILTETTEGANEFDTANDIVVVGSDVDLAVGETEALTVKAIYGGLTLPATIDNSKLTFTSLAPAKATVNANGVVTGVASGDTTIEVTVAGYPKLIATAHVTVTA